MADTGVSRLQPGAGCEETIDRSGGVNRIQNAGVVKVSVASSSNRKKWPGREGSDDLREIEWQAVGVVSEVRTDSGHVPRAGP